MKNNNIPYNFHKDSNDCIENMNSKYNTNRITTTESTKMSSLKSPGHNNFKTISGASSSHHLQSNEMYTDKNFDEGLNMDKEFNSKQESPKIHYETNLNKGMKSSSPSKLNIMKEDSKVSNLKSFVEANSTYIENGIKFYK
jgi:hypothetical protein